ncbi:DUF1501 domain-containing protein [Enterovibrio makurazakiensis]|uniref:DUF1501 domain-containing protein n=1 Tax=Enterovibrio makurazakiensis TaxID=2910232 RepID=UPI003D23264F
MKLTRRHFIKTVGAASAAASAPFSFSTYAENADDYKALVCVFLNGGNDFFHQVLPLDSSNYNKFASSRKGIAVPQQSVLPTHIVDNHGVGYGVHKALKPLIPLLEKGKATFAVNVGPLLEPTNKNDIVSGQASLPPYLFAHNKQQEVWQHSWFGDHYGDHGWLGMSMDVIADEMSSMPNCFYSGPNTLLDGFSNDTMFLNRNGFEELHALTSAVVRPSYESMATQHYDSPLVAGYAEMVKQAMSAQEQMAPVVDSIPQDTRIPASGLGSQLRAVKQMIEAAQMLGHNRQVFYVSIGGFDTHDNQVNRQDELMKEFSEAIAGFYEALEAEELTDNVMTFTMSEFGRSMHDNARQGTDHGWGGGQYIFGGHTHGGHCFGHYPDFTRNGQDDNGDGRLIPAIAHEQYAAYMVQWLGLSNGALNTVFPSLSALGGPMKVQGLS